VKLNPEQSKQFLEFINSKWKPSRKCEVCDQETWGITDVIFELREFSGGPVYFGGVTQPVIPIVCNTCGNTKFINAIKAGILKLDKKGNFVNHQEAKQ